MRITRTRAFIVADRLDKNTAVEMIRVSHYLFVYDKLISKNLFIIKGVYFSVFCWVFILVDMEDRGVRLQ